ncbi:hypothetical protein Rctr71_070 [Virus Rctr71]|nr:hypothetical protein Rctr71_070 [Virus Rctr71]
MEMVIVVAVLVLVFVGMADMLNNGMPPLPPKTGDKEEDIKNAAGCLGGGFIYIVFWIVAIVAAFILLSALGLMVEG